MKNHLETIFLTLRSVLLAVVTATMIFGPTTSMAATNTANWDIGGTGIGSASITINAYNTTDITLTKAAFTTGGVSLPNTSVVAAGTDVQFMLYIRNAHTFQMDNISLNDTLNPLDFTMVSGSFQYVAIPPASGGASALEADIYTAVTGAGASTAIFTDFATDGDIASYIGNTINIGTTGGDAQLDIPADTTWAIIFTATVLR